MTDAIETTVDVVETADVVEAVKTKPIYKKTDRTRSVDKHKMLDTVCENLVEDLRILLNRKVNVDITRSEERRYARALFKITIDTVVVDGKTMEEIVEYAQGIRTAATIKSETPVKSRPSRKKNEEVKSDNGEEVVSEETAVVEMEEEFKEAA